MGTCQWMGSHFHDWINYNGLAFSIEFTRMGSHIFGFWGKTVLHFYGYKTYQNVCTANEK